jgi:uncharacterized protein DUF6680
MELTPWIQVFGTLLSPLIALRVSRWLDNRRNRKERQLRVFRTLMATRARQLSMEHVEALNMIDVEFFGCGRVEKDVAVAWKEYLDHLNRGPANEAWASKSNDLFVELLYRMAICLGYDFDKVHIKNQSYSPVAHGDLETDQRLVRKGVISLLNGELALPIRVGAAPNTTKPELEDARAAAKPTLPPAAVSGDG